MSTISFDSLKPDFEGDIDSSEKTLTTYSRDASIFEIRPKVVVFPKHSKDVQTLVKWVAAHKAEDPTLSITARSAGTDMSGGAVGASIIADFTKYMNHLGSVTPESGTAEPGLHYRDFEKATMKNNTLMPTFPASRELCAIGGIVSNNSGGEKSLRYGQVRDFVTGLKVVFTDGNEYVVRPLMKAELDAKIAEGTSESELYKKLWQLIEANKDRIMAAKPDVSKNSAGYYLWDVYDPKTGTFDLCKLIVGSQGTLGLVTEATFKLVPAHPKSNILVVFMPDITRLSEIVNEILPFGPETLETFDDYSLKLAVKFFFDFWKQIGTFGMVRLGFQFIPDAWKIIRGGKIPKLMLLVEFAGDDDAAIKKQLVEVKEKVIHFGYEIHIARSQSEAEKYWRIRHESFNLLRKHVRNMRTAPFIEDVVVKPEHLPAFLPKLQALLDEHKLLYTIAGHAGDGNFHIIPLMDFKNPQTKIDIMELNTKVYDLVHEYKGSITAEHNDGLIRTPYLEQMFGKEMYDLFRQTKEIFDPAGILNPGKKYGATVEDIKANMAHS